ncbi:restriction endonuclease subunit S [Klebsiella pneumoniae]|uniref:restriction endonuclease subunit S n=2 Tax=Klebsiella pneumoniae TaxID=573 RepID=UPI000B3FB22F|nr:restriction endonuclease subunit S [Klebsiella pneumoniae]HDS7946054.1 restriction endonuclease subunit S [Klebsiella pneumoniae subsp. pneumoniae]EJI4914511.1 restriction endonuclease subunit S [Klebsiella pneumoniae]MBC4089831.1 restriction endonuclease subunit S [Klebsiella pneumoniae]MBW5949574.1 restriction endonuclease [Klebsiella pneumoniae]MCB8486325.1 restriction endonuclease subunit S [Klebsiella pneumoniae]
MTVEKLITDHIDIWSSALQTRSTAGRGSNGKIDLYGIKKLRELILELAVRGKLVSQDPNDEPASELLKRIADEKAELVKQGKIKKQKPLPEISEDEKPFELPEGWEWTRLGDIVKVSSGDGLTSSQMEVSGDIPVYGGNGINGYHDSFNVSKRTLVIGRVGFYCGSIHVTPSRAWVTDNAFKTEFSEENLYLDFLRVLLTITNLKENESATAQPVISGKKIYPIVVAIPPYQEQRSIVKKVEELMFLCEQLEQQSLTSLDAHQQLVETLLSTLTDSQNAEELAENWARISQHFDTLFTTEASIDALKQTILQLAVMGKLVPQDPNDEPASELLKRIEQEKAQQIKEGKIKKKKSFVKKDDGKIYELPNGWVQCHLGDIVTISSGDGLTSKQMAVDGNIPVYGGNGITGYHDNWNVDKPTIVIGRVGYYCGSVHITPSLAWVTDNAFITYYSKNNVDTCFLSLLLKGTNLKENENATAQPVISGSKIYPIVIMLPPLNEQKKIVKKFFELNCLCDTLKSRLQSAQRTQLNLADALTDAALN